MKKNKKMIVMILMCFLFMQIFSACSSDNFDHWHIEVQSVSPANGVTNVSQDESITAKFNVWLKSKSVNSETFMLLDSSGSKVVGNISCHENTITFLPDNNLKPDMTYAVKITGGVKGKLGGNLDSEYTWEFTTGGNVNQDLAKLLQKTLDDYRIENNITGISVAIIKPETTWKGTSGISHIGRDLTPEMLFQIGSNTKTFIAATILLLEEDGILSIDDKIVDWLPNINEYVDADVPNDKMNDISIRMLLQHTSGLGFRDEELDIEVFADPYNIWTLKSLLIRIIYGSRKRYYHI